MAKSPTQGPVTPRMNITPLIDVVFLLIVFFMLVSNIVAQENVKMVVPELDDPKTKELGDMERIVVNIEPAQDFDLKRRRGGQPLMHSGRAMRVKVGSTWFPAGPRGMDRAVHILKDRVQQSKNDEGKSELEVLLRADAALYYSEVQPVMAMITQAGVSKVDLVAYMPEEE